jgi:hypothetical protein
MKEVRIRELPIKCSYMNDTKWRKVLGVIASEKLKPRIKMVYDRLIDLSKPFGAFHQEGTDSRHPVEAVRIWEATSKYWDSIQGPFLAEEIEWVALAEADYARIEDRMPPNLMLVRDGGQVVIKGYEI